ncbi:glycosyltransferase family 4 protein [bacterium]|nr:glycosyltransferase family 4 protein [bacterium]
MKHIVFLYFSLQNGGAERVISSLANDFVNRGDRVTVVLLDKEKEPFFPLDERVRLIFLDLHSVSFNLLQSAAHMIKELRAFRKLFRKIVPDVVISFQCKSAVLAKKAYKRAKVIGSERANPERQNKKTDLWMRKKSAEVDGFIFQTNGAKGYYPPETQEKSTVIPNGFSLTLPDEIPSFDERNKVIITTGRLAGTKRYDLILDAFAAIRSVDPDYRLRIFGSGPEEGRIKEKIRALGLEDSAFVMGLTNDVAKELLSSRIFVLASDYEGMPNGLIEAMACGCACVSTDCDFGPSDLIENRENGLLVPKGDADAIASAIGELIADPDLASSCAKNAQKIRDTHSLKKIADRYYSYISEVAEK